MGIADRDYVRDEGRPAGGLGGGWRGVGRGGVGPRGGWSVTTWLIVVNIAVFALQALVFSHSRPITYYGTAYLNSASSAQIERAVVDRSVPNQAETPGGGVYFFAIRDPRTIVGVDAHGKPIGELVGMWRFVTHMDWLESWGHFSTGRVFMGGELWRFITFQFLHANFFHIALNMYALWMFGGLVEGYLGRRRFLAFYLLCGSCGALLYLVLNLAGNLLPMHVPGVLIHDAYTPLIGASAGVFGVLLASAFIAPNDMLTLFPIPIPMRLKTFAYGYALVALISLVMGSHNAGGEAAHIGGVIAGAWLIRRVDILRDIADFFDIFSSGKAKRVRGPSRDGAFARQTRGGMSARQEAAVDAILDKVSVSGIDSLSESEKKTLREATQRKK